MSQRGELKKHQMKSCSSQSQSFDWYEFVPGMPKLYVGQCLDMVDIKSIYILHAQKTGAHPGYLVKSYYCLR